MASLRSSELIVGEAIWDSQIEVPSVELGVYTVNKQHQSITVAQLQLRSSNETILWLGVTTT